MRIVLIILIFSLYGCSKKTNSSPNMKRKSEFSFNGLWELEFNFKAFEGLQSRRGSYTSQDKAEMSKGDIKLVIEDELNENPDPKPEQLKTIDYLSQNPVRVKNALLTSLPKYYDSQKELFGYDANEPEHQSWFPEISNTNDYTTVFGIGNVYILNAVKDGYSYYGLEGGCTWDDEHGIGFLMHKDRVVKVGDAAISFNSWEAYKDNGTHIEQQKRWDKENNNPSQKPKPILYKPHPKYGTLKPSQISENKMYENRLIERGFNEDFISLVESGKIDINNNKGLSMTFLQRASQFDNIEMCRFLFEQNPKDITGVIQNAAGHLNKELVELCLERGININEINNVKQTLFHRTNGQLNYWKQKGELDKQNEYKEFLDYIISKGAKE